MSPSSAKTDSTTSSAIDRIILAAEVEFSECGFDGVGMKKISVRAQVSQALLHYHFGSKSKLYEEVIARRTRLINSERLELLERVDLQAKHALDHILVALFKPPLGPSGGETAYGRIFTGLVVGQEREQALVRKFYDDTALRFIKAIEQAVPSINPATAAMGYTLSLGALIAVIGRNGRVERLMGREDLQDFDELLLQLVRFAQGGILALAET